MGGATHVHVHGMAWYGMSSEYSSVATLTCAYASERGSAYRQATARPAGLIMHDGVTLQYGLSES